jgi:hypothetical protein
MTHEHDFFTERFFFDKLNRGDHVFLEIRTVQIPIPIDVFPAAVQSPKIPKPEITIAVMRPQIKHPDIPAVCGQKTGEGMVLVPIKKKMVTAHAMH